MKLLFYIILLLPLFSWSQQEVEMCEGNEVTFTYSTNSNQPGNILWYINYSLIGGGPNLTINWTDYSFGTYTLTAQFTSIYSCDSDPVLYNVITKPCEEVSVYIPNCFTPNGDNTNESWSPKGFNYREPYFFIMNRWGSLLYTSNNFEVGWDGTFFGKMCPDGVYIYVVKWKDPKGRSYVDYGHLTLIR